MLPLVAKHEQMNAVASLLYYSICLAVNIATRAAAHQIVINFSLINPSITCSKQINTFHCLVSEHIHLTSSFPFLDAGLCVRSREEEELAFQLERASSRYTLLMERLLRLLLHTLLIMTLERVTGGKRESEALEGAGFCGRRISA